MAARKAVRYVTVGETTYAPGEEIPSDVVALIDNPAVWSDEEDGGDSAASDMGKAAAKRSNK